MPDLRHDTLDLLDTARRGVLIGGTQAGRQEVLAAEDVERQVELPGFLSAPQRRKSPVEEDSTHVDIGKTW